MRRTAWRHREKLALGGTTILRLAERAAAWLPRKLGWLTPPPRTPGAALISRYFFNIYNGESIFDDVGTDLANAREMRLHMIATALTLFEDEENQKRHWRMEALDEAGRIVGTMAFGVVDEESSV